ncbi:MAG: AMP-binding protein [Thermodesulfobacteriota bacterium]
MIKARVPAQNPQANLNNYDAARRSFKWSDIAVELGMTTDAGVNIIAQSIDKWAALPDKADQPAMIFQKSGRADACTFRQLRDISARWAGFFTQHGLVSGDCLMIFLPPCREFFFAMAACARAGIVFCPVFATSGYGELESRLADIAPKAVLTDPGLIELLPPESASALKTIFLTTEAPGLYGNEIVLGETPASLSADYPPRLVTPETALYLIYTSGSTRPPKGIIHSHGDMTGIYASARWALDLTPGDVLWTDADPAWVTGTVYAAFAPWLCGVASVVSEDPFTAANCYRTLESRQVTVWYTTPNTIRGLMEAGEDLPGRYDLGSLRHIATVGAPLMPDLFYWVRRHLGLSPHDNWWMSETGMICIANLPCLDIKPGAIGKPLPGVEVAILDDSGQELPFLSLGQLAIKSGWPAMMLGLWGDRSRYDDYFQSGWFLTGDIALQDEEGYFYHQGRLDDILKTRENRAIGPFEIEQTLCRHPAVAEAAVIARGGDRDAGTSSIKAFVTLKHGNPPSSRLNREIRMFLKAGVAPDIQVDEITFTEKLPRTRSGKLLRRVLRAWELGLPGGDAASMED